jgi:hypothetical protein
MPDITDYEAQQIEEANASELTPVVFIHGLWLLPSSPVLRTWGFTGWTSGVG